MCFKEVRGTLTVCVPLQGMEEQDGGEPDRATRATHDPREIKVEWWG